MSTFAFSPRWVTDGVPAAHKWSRWPSPFGEFVVDQQLAFRAKGGSTSLSGPCEATLAVASMQDGYGRYLRDGVELSVDGRSGHLIRPNYGLRASRRTMEAVAGEWRWQVRAGLRRLELRRGRTLVASNVGNEPAATRLHPTAEVHDAAIAVLLSINGLWDGAALWARYLARSGE